MEINAGFWRRCTGLLVLSATLMAVARSEDAPTPGQKPETRALAFESGEVLEFDVGWGVFRRAGRIRIAAENETAEAQKVTVELETRGTIRKLYRYEAQGRSWFDVETGRMLKAEYTEEAGSRRKSRVLEFDYEDGEVLYQDALEPERNVVLPLPDDDPLDLVTALVAARKWDLQPGDSRDVLVQADRRFYSLRLQAEQIETIQTPLGEFRALRIVPEPIGPPEGLFRRGGYLEVWVGQDERRLPLRIVVQLRVGTAVAYLVRHESNGRAVLEPVERERPTAPRGARQRVEHPHRDARQ